MDDLIGCQLEAYDEDVLMYYDSIKAFKPKVYQWEIKRNDDFSGNIPFAEYSDEEDKKDRGYMVTIDGEVKEIRIKAIYLEKFLEWNTSANDSLLDGRYVSTLMAVCIGKKNLQARNFSPITVDFLRGKIKYNSEIVGYCYEPFLYLI